MTNADIVNARFEALRKIRREMQEMGAGQRQPTQFQVVADGKFTRIRVVEGEQRNSHDAGQASTFDGHR